MTALNSALAVPSAFPRPTTRWRPIKFNLIETISRLALMSAVLLNRLHRIARPQPVWVRAHLREEKRRRKELCRIWRGFRRR